jgi:glycine dehydrogenase subunit 2
MTEQKHDKALIFELSQPGRVGYSLPACDVPEISLNDIIPEIGRAHV